MSFFYCKKRAKEMKQKLKDFRKESLDNAKKEKYEVQAKRRRSTSFLHNMSYRGGIKMACKRQIGHFGAGALARTLDTEFTRQTVARWELVLAATILAASRKWYTNNYTYIQKLKHADDRMALAASGRLGRAISWDINAVRCDATNSSLKEEYEAEIGRMSQY